MATFKWNTPLSHQRSQPVLRYRDISLPDSIGLYPEMLEQMFPSANHSLKTWGRTPGVKENDPHWIGVRKQTPLHTDKAYPRYTHQIMVNVDPGFCLRGVSLAEIQLKRGRYFVLDTHSPHQLFAGGDYPAPQWYLALSLDTFVDDAPDADVIHALLGYAATFKFDDVHPMPLT